MTIEIPDKIYRPCSTCSDDTCVFYGDKDTHEICTDYKDKRLAKAIEEIRKLPKDYGYSNLVNGAIDDVLEILEKLI